MSAAKSAAVEATRVFAASESSNDLLRVIAAWPRLAKPIQRLILAPISWARPAPGLRSLFLTGDATDEDRLLEAGVKRASSLIVALRCDADNVFLALTARNLNPRLRIIARGEQPVTEKKRLQAEADRVVMPAVLDARRMAAMVSHPHAAELIDLVTDHRALNATLEELQVHEESPWAGKSIRDAGTRAKHHLLIVALHRADGSMVFNPEADLVVQAGDTAIVMGKSEDIQSFRREYRL